MQRHVTNIPISKFSSRVNAAARRRVAPFFVQVMGHVHDNQEDHDGRENVKLVLHDGGNGMTWSVRVRAHFKNTGTATALDGEVLVECGTRTERHDTTTMMNIVWTTVEVPVDKTAEVPEKDKVASLVKALVDIPVDKPRPRRRKRPRARPRAWPRARSRARQRQRLRRRHENRQVRSGCGAVGASAAVRPVRDWGVASSG